MQFSVQVHLAKYDPELFQLIRRKLIETGVPSDNIHYTSDNTLPIKHDGGVLYHVWVAGKRWSNLVPAFKRSIADTDPDKNIIVVMWEKSPKNIPYYHAERQQDREEMAKSRTLKHIRGVHGKNVSVFMTLDGAMMKFTQLLRANQS
ncbi:MAG: hypothetical protein HZC02_00195 [Candidatus Levybacteria bacterium]|nr:hypothetical protein [Candidatus Levybacteria bacterium]